MPAPAGQEPELLDLDQFLADEAADAPQVRLHGETVRVQPDPPYDLLVTLYRTSKLGDDDADVAPDVVMDIVKFALGAEVFDRWRAKGIGARAANKIMDTALAFWGFAGPEAEAGEAGGEGEAAAPKEATSGPSSPTGPSSSPTSNANTGSTSSPSGDGSAGPGSGSSSPASPQDPGSPWPSEATTGSG
jgi:hypothetical protein